jgi:hypothetical protein
MGSTEVSQKPLSLLQQQRRMLSATQAYSKLFIDLEMKDTIAAQWKDYIAKNPNKKGSGIGQYNAAIQGLYNVETNEVKAEVKRRCQEGIFSEDKDIETDNDVEISEQHVTRQGLGDSGKFSFISSPFRFFPPCHVPTYTM